MKALLAKHLFKSIAFGIIMTMIGFFSGNTVFTFPPLWSELIKLFLIYSVTFFIVNALVDWIHERLRKDNH